MSQSERKPGLLLLLNIATIVATGFTGGILTYQSLTDTDLSKDNRLASIIAGVVILVISGILVFLFTYVTWFLLKGIFKRKAQIVGSVFFSLVTAGIDVVVHGHFANLSAMGKGLVVGFNILAVLEMTASMVAILILDKQLSSNLEDQ